MKKTIVFWLLFICNGMVCAQIRPSVSLAMDYFNSEIDTFSRLDSAGLRAFAAVSYDSSMHMKDSNYTSYVIGRNKIRKQVLCYGEQAELLAQIITELIFDKRHILESVIISFKQYDIRNNIINRGGTRTQLGEFPDHPGQYVISRSSDRRPDGEFTLETFLFDSLVIQRPLYEKGFHQNWRLVSGSQSWIMDSMYKMRFSYTHIIYDSSRRPLYKLMMRPRDCMPIRYEQFAYKKDSLIHSMYEISMETNVSQMVEQHDYYPGGHLVRRYAKNRLIREVLFSFDSQGRLIAEEVLLEYKAPRITKKYFYFR